MILSQKKIKKNRLKSNKLSNFFRYYFITTISFLILSIFLFFTSDMWSYYKWKLYPRLEAYGILNLSKLPEIIIYKIKGEFLVNKKINIDIDFDEIIKIENEREKVVKETLEKETGKKDNYTFQFKYYNATILIDGKKVPIRIRLKGDRDIHWKDKFKSSYRIKIKGDEKFNGLKEFSIQKPRARNYIYEWIFHELSSELDSSIDLKYEFFDLNINGIDQGLYVLEEVFSKILIERSKKRDGPIFSLKEDFLIKNFTEKKFQVYKEKYWLNDQNIKLTNLAYTKLKNTFSNKIKLSDSFDLKSAAWYTAFCDLLHTYHGLYLKSPKFFYNPVKGLFEIIPFDGHWWNPILSSASLDEINKLMGEQPLSLDENSDQAVELGAFLTRKLYEEEDFAKEYYLALKEISSKNYLDNFFDSRKKEINLINAQIYADYFWNDFLNFYGPGVYYFDKNRIYKKANLIQKKLIIDPSKIYAKLNKNIIQIENQNLINPFVKINKIICKEKEIVLTKSIILNNLKKEINFENVNPLSCYELNLYDELNDRNFKIEINHLNFVKQPEKKKDNFLNYFKNKDKDLLLKNNTITVNENIIIPNGYTVKILPGQNIILNNNAFILSYSNFVIGEKGNNKKAYVGGIKDNFGGGIFINSKKPSLVFNSEFSFLNGIVEKKSEINFLDSFKIYGSVNFFDGNVEMENVNFNNINSEDALNIISSKYRLNNLDFVNIKSDAIDIDFGNGSISNSSFEEIGNDAIDFSGSRSSINNINFINIGDKSVSIGESSELEIYNLDIFNSFIGFAIKDGSKVKLSKSLIKNGKYGIALYQKKNEYNKKNEIFINDVELTDVEKDYLTNEYSIINNNQKLNINIIENNKIIKALYENS